MRPHAVETDEPHDDLKEVVGGRSGNRPIHIGSLGVNGVVVQNERRNFSLRPILTEPLSHFIEEFGC